MARQGERTEKATSRRRQRARDQGQFAYSQELTSAMTLAACVVTAFYSLRSPAGFGAFFASLLENAETQSASELVRQTGTYFLIVAAPIFAAAIIGALEGNFIQGLPMFPREFPALKWDRRNLEQGLSRLHTHVAA